MAATLAEKKKVRPVLDRIRNACLRRGANGIRGLGRAFRIMDDNRSGTLTSDELKTGFEDWGVLVEKDDLQNLIAAFDTNGDGSVSLTEFLVGVRGDMSDVRRSVVEKAFRKFDADGSGFVDRDDMQQGYGGAVDSCDKFLATFEDQGSADGVITHEEFVAYYTGLSAGIDCDDHFVAMMDSAWKLDSPTYVSQKRQHGDAVHSPVTYNASFHRKREANGTIVKSGNAEDPDRLRLLTGTEGVHEVALPPEPPRRVVGYTGHIKGAQESFGECFSKTEQRSLTGGKKNILPTPVFKDEAAAFSRKGNAANAHNFKLE
eukprot:TRINITY_DN1727_c0_g1_i1.p1 TRINITY_DN1727_c0_g1~~TRINITY_DN1727_c0_g1_i1.p1  ORF type:complete len:317 (+),score=78.61 TRINITY_DN1727_c0_g1_i1:76-1026(+)